MRGSLTQWLRQATTMSMSVLLIAAGLIALDNTPASANQWACKYFPVMCSSGYIGGGTGNTTPAPQPPPPPPPAPPRTPNPAFTWSGTAYFDNPYGNTHYNAVRRDPSGLPGGRGAFTAHDGNYGTIWVRGNGDNHYRGQCKTDARQIWNPVTGTTEVYYPYGVRWTDRMYWGSDGSSYRTVSYSCLWPGAPRPVVKYCAYWGAGKLDGPLINSTGYPVVDDKGQQLITTKPRQWTAPRTNTTLGSRWEATGKNPLLGMSAQGFAGYVSSTCSDFNYLGWFNNEQCTMLYSGQQLSGDDCAVVPGNYTNKFRGQQLWCGWTYYPYWNFYRAAGCREQNQFRENRPVAQYCQGRSPAGRGVYYNGWDTRYNFATCGNTFAAPRCDFHGAGKAPKVIAPGGERASLSTQALANGQQWQLEYPTLTIPEEADNKRQQWILAQGSEPFRGGDPGGDHQPYLAHYDPRAQGDGVLVFADSDRSYSGWDKETLYLRMFQAGGIADAGGFRLGEGQVSNPTTVPNNEAIPLGIFARYHYTAERTITTEVGGSITIDVPFECSTSMATFYTVMGRATD